MTENIYLECGAGWKRLYGPILRWCELEGVDVYQVKEKFGALSIYTGPCSKELHAAIASAEKLSTQICEVCGEPGERRGGSWVKTLCDEHADKQA